MSSPTVPVVTVEDVEKISSPAAEPADGEVEPDLPGIHVLDGFGSPFGSDLLLDTAIEVKPMK
jgi:hypothetical protein